MFVKNPITADPRVKREALHLKNAGYDVSVIGTPASGLPRKEVWEGVKFFRIPRLGSKFGRVLKRILGRNERYRKSVSEERNGRNNISFGIKKDRQKHFGLARLLCFVIGEIRTSATWVTKGLTINADAYHAHDLNTLSYALLCSFIARKKVVYDSHELWIEWKQTKHSIPPEQIWWWKFIEVYGLRAADLVVAVSDGIADELRQMYGVDKPLVVRNCAPIKPLVESRKLREKIGGDSSRPIILYQGGFALGRGLEEIIEGAKEVPQADFVLMGLGVSYKAKIKKIVEESGLSNVFILPNVRMEELWIYTQSADIGLVMTQPVCKSYKLSMSNKIFEYMVAGIPIVASTIESHQHLARETGALELVDPYDPQDIALAINRLLESPERMKQMGINARKWAERKYNTSKEMEKLRLAHDRICGKPSS